MWFGWEIIGGGLFQEINFDVEIVLSETGRTCTFLNPWGAQPPVVTDAGGQEVTVDKLMDPSEWPRGVVNVDGGVLFRFETAVGGEYRLATR